MIKVDSKGNITLPLHMVPSRGYMLRVPKFGKQFYLFKMTTILYIMTYC